MGIGGIREICRQLIAHGLPGEHPAAVVQNGSSERQRHHRRPVVIAERVSEAGITSPALIIVGTVATLHKKLAWFVPD